MSSKEEGVGVGFLVDKINTVPFQKAVERGEVPFCAFSPISTDELFLLRIQDCPDISRHMLVPASKDEVLNTPGALKDADGTPDPDNTFNYKVAIVAIARQVYSEEQKQLFVSVEPLLKKDRKNVNSVKFLSVDKFADFAFAGFDGNVSEFAKKSKNTDENKNCDSNDSNQDSGRNRSEFNESMPSQANRRDKSPVKPPSRRGRGGRRGGGRGRRSSPSSRGSPSHRRGYRGRGGGNSRGDHASFQNRQQHQLSMVPQQIYTSFPSQAVAGSSFVQVPNDCLQNFVKMEGQTQSQPFFTEVPFPMPNQISNMPPDQVQVALGDDFNLLFPVETPEVPMACSEITVGQTGESDVPPPNHDIFTIAIDQLMTLTYEQNSDAGLYAVPGRSQSAVNGSQQNKPERGTTGTRGGRRPGRKPGRKSMANDKNLQMIDENNSCAFGLMAADVTGVKDKPKRRGRPPKNKIVLQQVTVPENENTVSSVEEFENYEKRLKLQIAGD